MNELSTADPDPHPLPQTRARSPFRAPLPVLLLLLLAWFLLGNMSLVIALQRMAGPRPWLMLLGFHAIGAAGAQVVGVSLWMSLGPGPFLRRMLGGSLVAILLYAAIAVGTLVEIALRFGTDEFINHLLFGEELWGLLMGLTILPAIVMAAQVPFWGCRLILGWRITAFWETPPSLERLTIFRLMILTVVIGLVITSVKAAWQGSPVEIWAILAIYMTVAAGISVSAGVPAVIWVLRWRNAALALIALMSIGAAICTFLGVLIYFFVPPAGWAGITMIADMVLSFLFLLGMWLLGMRQAGCHLQCGDGDTGHFAAIHPTQSFVDVREDVLPGEPTPLFDAAPADDHN